MQSEILVGIEQAQRERVIRIARSWLRTPFQHEAKVKGAGVDCAQLLIGVYAEAGIIEDFRTVHYSSQWHLHRDDEKYIETISKFAHEIAGPPLPADVVVYKFARCFSHAAIVVEWPRVLIHSYINRGCELVDPTIDGQFAGRPHKFFSAWGR